MADYRLRVQRVRHGVSKAPARGKAARSKQQQQQASAGVRMVYIASPMKLTASPEEFRAVVQELTGRHSNIADRDYVDSIHPPPSYCSAAPPPVQYSSLVLPVPPPLPRRIFQVHDHGELEEAPGPYYGQLYYQ
ncbi:hypothetical protein GUJ93_ZPchr0013g34894 [Zizania palustris]|uniref:VQ domain-containing protein n=1 Tax=Zizania palustris TaxID=103762 RepID=A0A8J6C0I7_ZIZPA|nr:hypothetical protein GUJ93_ZPchr0013g34894 [Zizania palustris]